MLNRTRHFLFLTSGYIDLWRQRGRTLDKMATLPTDDPDYSTQLRQLLVAQKCYRVALLLNLPDLTVQVEATPAVGLFDRRKLVARRLDYLFPRAVLGGAKIGKTNTQLAALRPQAALTATLQAIVGVGAELVWIAHAALEAPRLIPVALQATPYIAVLKLGDCGLLLAGERGMLLAARHLPLAQLESGTLAAEIQSTFAYLQRHGWRHTQDLSFIGFGVELPSVSGLPFARTALYPTADGYAELLAQLAQARKPLQPLSQPRLARLHKLRNLRQSLNYGAMLAAGLTMLCFAGCYHLFAAIATQNNIVMADMAALPPPLAIRDLPLLKQLQHSFDAPLALAAALPDDDINGISYQAAPLAADESYMLRLTATAKPALADWQLKSEPNAVPISGTIGQPAKAQPENYNYTYRLHP